MGLHGSWRWVAVAGVVVALAVFVAPPGEPRVDGASRAALLESLEDVVRSAEGARRERLEQALLALTSIRLGGLGCEGRPLPCYRELLNGLCADEIIALAEKLEAPAPRGP